MSLNDWLIRIEARPGMYLQPAGLATLSAFIDGYQAALPFGKSVEEDAVFFLNFNGFVLEILGRVDERTTLSYQGSVIDLGALSWRSAISSIENDDEKALALFFSILRQFKSHA